MKEMYQIIVGETGNWQGHGVERSYVSDTGAIRAARRMARAYRGDGWWTVREGARLIERGGTP